MVLGSADGYEIAFRSRAVFFRRRISKLVCRASLKILVVLSNAPSDGHGRAAGLPDRVLVSGAGCDSTEKLWVRKREMTWQSDRSSVVWARKAIGFGSAGKKTNRQSTSGI